MKTKSKEQFINELKLHQPHKQKDKMKKIINVHTGEVKAGKNTILKSNAIGSCVVIAAYDSTKKLGALAHVMLTGAAPEGKTFQRTRYAADAIEEIINSMILLGAKKDEIEVCLVGGGNVLKREDDTICHDIITSVVELLNEKHIEIRKKAVGGTERRSLTLDIENGIITYTERDSQEKVLWKTNEKNSVST